MAKTGIGAPLVFSSSVGESSWVNGLPVSSNPNYLTYFNDFYTATNFNTTLEWNLVKDASATAAILGNAPSGQVLFTSAATTDNDGNYAGLAQRTFRLLSNKQLWFSARFSVASQPQDMDFWTGMSIGVTTNPENVVADSTTRIGFELIEAQGTAVLQFKTSDGTNVNTYSTGVTVESGDFVKVDFKWDGKNTIEYFVNNIKRGQTSLQLPASSATLTPGMFQLSGNNVNTFTAAFDYIQVVAER